MTRTRPSILIVLLAVGGIAGWVLEYMLVASGRPTLIPPVTLAIALGVIGVLMVLLALPVWRVVRRVDGARVDPFYATRVVLLAKASSLTGALLAGLATAVLLFLLTRSVTPGSEALVMAGAAVVGSVMLAVGGLVAERMCTLPPDDDANRPPNTGGVAG